MYDEIYVDEVQDMTGYDLDILEQLLKSTSTIRLVGDIRQSVFDTNPQDPRHKNYRGLAMLDWFRAQHEAGRLDINYSSETWRCVQEIATFADTIFASALGFPPTVSRQIRSSEHDGVFVVASEHVDAYVATYRPATLRQTIATAIPEGHEAANFGVSKGLTLERVLIFPTKPIKAFLSKGKLLTPKSACGLYVGVTRAVFSVAFVTDKPNEIGLPVWAPLG